MEHWLHYKEQLAKLGAAQHVDVLEIYRESLKEYGCIDWHDFQSLPMMQLCLALTGLSHAPAQEIQSSSLLRLVLEESYAVLSFEKAGCRVIRPSLALINVLSNVEVNWRLTDICPPYSHVFIAFPPGYTVPAADTGDEIVCEGLYVTWAKLSDKTIALWRSLPPDSAVVLRKDGIVVPADSIPPEERLSKEMNPADIYGDWAARFFMIYRANKGRYGIAQYFNMHWASSSTELAEGAFNRFKTLWVERDPVAEKGVEHTYLERGKGEAFRSRVFHLVCNLYLWMSQPSDCSDVEHHPCALRDDLNLFGHHWNNKRRKRARERLFQEMPTDEYVVGQHVTIAAAAEVQPDDGTQSLGGAHASPKPHWRRGHWHRFWTGPHEGERKLVPKLLSPVLVMAPRSGKEPVGTVLEVR